MVEVDGRNTAYLVKVTLLGGEEVETDVNGRNDL
jgi:hypothetical protein